MILETYHRKNIHYNQFYLLNKMQIVNNLTLDVTNVRCIIFIKIYALKSLVCKLIYTNIVNVKTKINDLIIIIQLL